MALEFGPLRGDFGKLFMFMVGDDECIREVVSIGSYETTASFGRSIRRSSPGKRLYHADLYDRKSHATLGFYDGPPAYEEAKRMAIETLAP